MPAVKYRFNKKSLQFEVVQVTLLARIKRILTVLATGLVFAVVVIFFAYSFLDSPKEKMLKREIAQYELQLKLINERIIQYDAILADMADRDDNIYRVIFEADPVPTAYRKGGFGGSDRYANLAGYRSSQTLIETTRRLDNIKSKLVVQSESFDEVYHMALNKAEMLACIPAIQPLNNKDMKRLSSYYGFRTDPIYKVMKFHPGIDFSAPKGTEIYATGDGVVSDVVFSRAGYGNRIVIDHGYGYETVYAHIQEFKTKKGQKVKRGQLIATVGNTGKSTAPHLHYEVLKDGKNVNPIYFFFNDLTPEQYELVLELSAQPTQTLD